MEYKIYVKFLEKVEDFLIHKSRLGVFQYCASNFIAFDKQPDFFIAPQQLLDLKTGIMLFDVENYIFRNIEERNGRKVTVICSEAQRDILRNFISISLFGLNNYEDFQNEFHTTYQASSIPNLKQDTKIFYQHYFNIDSALTVDLFVNFITFDSKQSFNIFYMQEEIFLDEELHLIIGQDEFILQDDETILHTFKRKIIQQQFIEAVQQLNQKFMSERRVHRSICITVQSQKLIQEYNQVIPQDEQVLSYLDELNFVAPLFGVTPLSDPFKQSNISGLILWINGRGALIDPPPFTKQLLLKLKISSRILDWIILTNVFTRNDAGLMQRLIESQRLEIITTPTILKAFLQKQSHLIGHQPELMRKLVKFKPILIGATINLNGATIRFSYGFNYGPCLQFEAGVDGKQIMYTGANHFDPKNLILFQKRNQISLQRYEMLSNLKWVQNLIFMQAGDQPWKTPWKSLKDFSQEIVSKIIVLDSNLSDIHTQKIQCQNRVTNNATMVLDVKKDKALEYLYKLDILSQMDIFEGLTMKNLRDLLEVAQSEEFSAGQLILKEGTLSCKWYIILRGVSQIVSQNAKWQRQFSVGDYFGETALIESEKQIRRMASVEAITQVSVLTLQKHDFWCTFGSDPGSVGNSILQKMMSLVTSRQSQGLLAIQQNKYLSELSQSQYMSFEMMMQEMHYSATIQLWKDGQDAMFVCLVFKGELRLTNPISRQEVMITAGMFVGDIEAILLDTPQVTQLEVVTDCILFQIHRDDLISYVKKHPGFFLTYGQAKYFH